MPGPVLGAEVMTVNKHTWGSVEATPLGSDSRVRI